MASSIFFFSCGLKSSKQAAALFLGCAECGKCEFYHRLHLLRRRLSINSSRGTQRKSHVRIQQECSHLQPKERSLTRNQPCWHLDLGLPVSRTGTWREGCSNQQAEVVGRRPGKQKLGALTGTEWMPSNRSLQSEETKLHLCHRDFAYCVRVNSHGGPCCHHQDPECDRWRLLPGSYCVIHIYKEESANGGLGFGSFLGIIGSNLVENKRQMLVASIVFISFGVIAAFCCAIVDGVFAARHIVNCPHLSRGFCTPRIRGNTCFCCDLYNCGNRVEITGGYYEYIDVSSCQDIIHLYHLLWSATILNIVGLFLGIITAAVLGGFKDMNPTLPALNCSVENSHPTVSYYARPQVASYNTYYHSPPHLPPYSAYDFQHSSVFPSSPPSGLSDEPQSASPSPSYMWSSSAPPRYSPPYYPPFEKPPPYSP
ncbi:transmembrane protein 255A isoform X3 [Equus asinus]|uniref:transmembrane protein 255A isoform X3 n=1 Tax=Equus asinus TaxID=9793 RepID=UPI0038F631FD